MNRNQWLLAGLLALQLVLILLFRSPFAGSAASSEPSALLPQLEAFTPQKLLLSKGDEDRLTLAKDGEGWAIEELSGFPASAEKVESLLDDLRGLRVRRPVVSSSRYHETFRIADSENEGRIRVFGAGEADPQVDLVLGSSPNYRVLHVRRGGEDPVFEVQGLSSYDARPEASAWIEPELVDVPREQVVALELSNDFGTLAIEKRDGAWIGVAPASLAGRTLDAEKVDSLLRSAASVRIADPAGPLDERAQGFTDGGATVKLSWTEPAAPAEDEAAPASPAPRELTLRVGGKPEGQDNQRYVTRSGFPFAGTVWDSSVSALLERRAADLLPGGDDA